MTRLISPLIVFAAIFTQMAPVQGPVYFADQNLKAAVEDSFGISDPNAEEMLLLTHLNAGERNIVDLTGLVPFLLTEFRVCNDVCKYC